MVPGPAASASPGNLLEMQTLGPYPRPPGLETLGLKPRDLLTRLLGDIVQPWEKSSPRNPAFAS